MATDDFSSFSQIVEKRTTEKTKAPAYPWQDLALRIIQELGVPNYKRGAVFKVCRDCSSNLVLIALADTKELCPSGLRCQYFFKVIDSLLKNKPYDKKPQFENNRPSR